MPKLILGKLQPPLCCLTHCSQLSTCLLAFKRQLQAFVLNWMCSEPANVSSGACLSTTRWYQARFKIKSLPVLTMIYYIHRQACTAVKLGYQGMGVNVCQCPETQQVYISHMSLASVALNHILKSYYWWKKQHHQVPYGLAVRIPGFHPGGPGSTPGMGKLLREFRCSCCRRLH